MIIILS